LFVFAVTAVSAADFNWHIPAGFPKPAVPPDNPMSEAKVELGRYLFYDARMSSNGGESCATCHKQKLAFTDGRAHAEGTTGQAHPRGAMSLVNVAYATSLTWANPALGSLEEQALGPMLNETPIELGLRGYEREFLNQVRRDPVYMRLFPAAFPGGADIYTLQSVIKALATFERSIVSMRSPYDRYRWGGDLSAISDSAKRGELIFFSSERGRCFRCHDGWNFSSVRFEGSHVSDGSDGSVAMRGFFNTGVAPFSGLAGAAEFTKHPEDAGKFRAPTLRNVAVTAPYMHDGSLATLEEVIDHYAAGGKYDNPNKSQILTPLKLSEGDKQDLVEFLRSLTDEEVLRDPRWSNPW
jgi:cytochrome c peroxidase